MTHDVPPQRLPAWMIVSRGQTLSVERARRRVSAYVYGTILVLAAIATQTGETIEEGFAAVAVAATTVTTLLAHIVADAVGQQFARTADERRFHLREEARDAMPILIAGIVPFAVMLLAAFGLLGTNLAQLIAGAWIVLRLAVLGVGMQRGPGQRMTRSALWSGISLALVSTVVVALKATWLH